MDIFEKNRNREKFHFANINLLGKCNVNCYFCLGKDIPELLNKHNQLFQHFKEWKNFEKFLSILKENDIKKIYLTGQNTDPLLYKYLPELIDHLKEKGFFVGIRTNGYLAKEKINEINKLNDEVGYSIHSLDPEINKKILGRDDKIDWENILNNSGDNVRVAIVVNKYNINEVEDIIKYLSTFDKVKYIQVRRISTDTRKEEFKGEAESYEKLFDKINNKYGKMNDFYSAQRFNIYGKEVCFWRTTQTTSNSMNYFTDGTVSDCYFIVEGYMKNYEK